MNGKQNDIETNKRDERLDEKFYEAFFIFNSLIFYNSKKVRNFQKSEKLCKSSIKRVKNID
jgi:hypothetical protein